jgi:hypothetical protein
MMRQLIVLGGGFLMEKSRALDRYFLAATGKPNPHICFICLGWLPGSACPHYDGEAERRPAFHRMLADGRIPPGYAADDGVALHFIDDELAHVVASRPAAKGYRLTVERGTVVETMLPVRVLDESRASA